MNTFYKTELNSKIPGVFVKSKLREKDEAINQALIVSKIIRSRKYNNNIKVYEIKTQDKKIISERLVFDGSDD